MGKRKSYKIAATAIFEDVFGKKKKKKKRKKPSKGKTSTMKYRGTKTSHLEGGGGPSG